jgi:hypothetical protein
VVSAGAVNVLYGSLTALTATGDQYWHQNRVGIENTNEANDHSGYALAAGDFDRDGDADLAIGVPDEDIGSVDDGGAVHILTGSPTGITAPGDQFWDQGIAGVNGTLERDDRFGAALAAIPRIVERTYLPLLRR